MQKRIANNKMWIWLPLLLVLLLGARYLSTQEQLKMYPMYASDSPSLTGVKAFYSYLTNHHEDVNRWSVSPIQLPTDAKKQVLIMVEPYFIPNSEDIYAYKQFMEVGNTILLLQTNPKGMFALETEFMENDNLLVFDQKNTEYHVESPMPFRLKENSPDEVLLSDDAGTIALKRKFGEGQLIVANSPAWIMNEKVVYDDHLALVLGLLHESDAETFWVDEYIHGGENASTIFTVYPRWFLLLIGQAIVLTTFWLWARGKRFGPIFIPREETVRFSDEGIRALAAWYIRGRRYHDSLVIQENYVKVLLQERWRIPYPEDWQDLTAHFERKWPHMSNDEINALLTSLTEVMNKEKVSKSEYLLWSKELDRIRTEVEVG